MKRSAPDGGREDGVKRIADPEGAGPSDASPSAAAGEWSQIAPDVLAAVLALLPVHERCRASRVCRSWRAAALLTQHTATLKIWVLPEGSDQATLPLAQRVVPRQRVPPGSIAAQIAAEDAKEEPTTAPLTAGEAAEALRGPIPALSTELELFFAGAGAWRAEALAAALPPALRRLRVVAKQASDATRTGLVRELRIGERPSLRELAVKDWIVPSGPHLPLRHGALEVVGGTAADPTAAPLLEAFPSLRRIDGLFVMRGRDGESVAQLAALARAGVRCNRLDVRATDLSGPEAAAALAVFAPVPPSGSLEIHSCQLPEAWPGGLPPGVERIRLYSCALRTPMLDWLLRGRHVSTLRELHLDRSLRYPELALAELAGALEGVPPSCRVRLCWPLCSPWDDAAFSAGLERLASSRELLSKVEFFYAGRVPGATPAMDRAFSRYRAAREAALAPPPPPPPAPPAPGQGQGARAGAPGSVLDQIVGRLAARMKERAGAGPEEAGTM
eukprot:tig00021348_g20552.t1